MQASNGLEKVYLLSLSPTESAEFTIKAAAVRITHNVLRRSIEDLIDVELFPMVDMSKADFMHGMQELADDCQDRSALIGISVMSSDYPFLREVSALLRKQVANTPIIGGGPHFAPAHAVRGKPITRKSTAEKALDEGLVDIVNVGQGSPLRELILGLQAGDLRFVANGKGFALEGPQSSIPNGIRYSCPDGQIKGKGKGKGKGPHITHGNPYIMPMRYSKGVGVNFNLSNLCPNNCSYCNSPKQEFRLKPRTYIDELARIMPHEEIAVVQSNDNHPFERCNRQKTFQFLNAFRKNGNDYPLLYNFFIDPSTLLEHNSDDLWSFFGCLKGKKHQFQFGRECTVENVAAALGRRYRGKPRDQRRLDAEGEAIKKVARKLPESRFKVFYILTPFESEESVLSMIREVESFVKYGNIYTGSNLLWPLPGSANSEKYNGLYFSFEDVPAELGDKLELMTPMGLNFWHPSLPGCDLLDYLMGMEVKIYLEPELSNNTLYHLNMMRIVASIAFGTYKPADTVPSLVDDLHDNPEQKSGDIHGDYAKRILAMGESIDSEDLFECSVRSKIRLSELVREEFWLWDKAKLQKFRLELECIHEFRNSYFGI